MFNRLSIQKPIRRQQQFDGIFLYDKNQSLNKATFVHNIGPSTGAVINQPSLKHKSRIRVMGAAVNSDFVESY